MFGLHAKKNKPYRLLLIGFMLQIPLLGAAQNNSQTKQTAENTKQTIEIARSLYDQNPDSSVVLMESLLPSVTKSQNPEIRALEAEIRKTLSTALNLVGQPARALKEGKKAVKLHAQRTDTIGMGVAHANLGMIYFGLTLYSEAAEEYGNALFYLKNRGKDATVAGVNNNLGNLLMVQDKYEEARAQYQGALKTYRHLNIPSGVSYTINNIGVINEKQKKYAAAIDCYLQALKIDEKENDLWGQVNGNLNLGDVFYLTGRDQQALNSYLKGLEIAEKISDVPGIIRALLALAEYKTRMGQYNTALEYAQRGLVLAEKTGNKLNLNSLLTNLTDISSKLGRPQEALTYHKKLLQNQKEFHIQEKQLTERTAKEQAEVRLIDALDQNQELENELNQQKSLYAQAERIHIIGVVALLMMLLVGARYLSMHRKRQQIQLSEQNRREQEIEVRQRQKLHDTQEELYLEQKLQAQNINMFLKEISQRLEEIHLTEIKTPQPKEQALPQKTEQRAEQLRGHIEDLMLLINIQHHPREFPPTQNAAEELITQALHGINVSFQLIKHRSGLLIRTHPALFYLMFRNLVEWMEAPYTQNGRPLQPLHIDLLEPKHGHLPIQLKWVDYDPKLLSAAHQSVLQLSNRRFDWPISIENRTSLGGLAIVHQSLQQLGGQASMDMPKRVPGLTLQVLVPLQD